jgi:hypothetical protein
MSNEIIINGATFNKNSVSLTFAKPKPHGSGSKVVNVSNHRAPVKFSTPMMLTWGAQEGLDPSTGLHTGKWTVAHQFPSAEYATEGSDNFLEAMIWFRNQVQEAALINSKDWFGKDYNSDPAKREFNQLLVNEKFNVMLRHPKREKGSAEVDETRPPTLTAKVPCWSGKWQSEIYDELGNPLFVNGLTGDSPLPFLQPKSNMISLLECGGIWLGNGKVSIVWNLKQAIVQTPKTAPVGKCRLAIPAGLDMSVGAAAAAAEQPPGAGSPSSSVAATAAVSATVVDDTDDEAEAEAEPDVEAAEEEEEEEEEVVEEPEPEPEPEPTPAPAPVAKVVKKKVVRKAAA